MTGEEIKSAALAGVPVEYFGVVYKKINHIIYVPRDGRFEVLAELADVRTKSTMTAQMRFIKSVAKEDGDGE